MITRLLALSMFLLAPACSSTGAGDGGTASSDSGSGPADAATSGGAGCGRPTTLMTGSWVAQSLMVGGSARDYFVYLPAGYDPTRAYPVVYQFHGCSSSADRQNNNVPVEKHSGEDAIHIRGRAAADCWDTKASGVDVPFVDALIPAVDEAFCTDTSRRYATGYSGGSFMAHVLACTHGSQLRAVATIAGGQAGNACTGNVAALLIHDDTDGVVKSSASVAARDDHAKRNHCDTAAARTPTADPPCEAYAGCDAGKPVVWCPTTGKGHDRQDSLAGPAFWHFLSAL